MTTNKTLYEQYQEMKPEYASEKEAISELLRENRELKASLKEAHDVLEKLAVTATRHADEANSDHFKLRFALLAATALLATGVKITQPEDALKAPDGEVK